MKSFEGKLHTVAGEWASIPITADKSLFDSMVLIGKAMANVEKNNYRVEESLVSSIFGLNLMQEYLESEIHSYVFKKNAIELLDIHKYSVLTIPVDEEVLNFEVSGYNVVREWLKYHSYAYFRKTCNATDIKDLLCLIIRIREYIEQVNCSDKVMKEILANELIKPIK